MHDLVIANGTIVDGTGADRFLADIAIDADINVIDHDRLRVKAPHLVADLPAGERPGRLHRA